MAKDTPKPKPTTNIELKPQTSTAGVLVLQWLTYAFWGWLIVALIWVMSVVLVNAIIGTSVGDVVPYAIAASVVLLPLAFVTDLFYRKHEPLRKAGAATVIMVIHAVIFALLGIGALITSVFTGLNALINIADSNDSTLVVVLVAVFATILYTAAFLRTLNPFKKKTGALVYAFSMLGVTLVLLTAAIVGPVVATIATRGDRNIEQALPTIQSAIRNYATRNNELPANLDQLSIRSDKASELIASNGVEYIPEGKVTDNTGGFERTHFRYQLCVVYDRESQDDSNYYDSYGDVDNGGYATYLDVSLHDAGRTCYKLRTY